MNKTVIIIISLVSVLLIVGAVFLASYKAPEDPKITAFAKCLSEKGAVMYGAYWCPHCQAQKKLFGASVKYLNYVECTVDVNACQNAKIDGYPTWIFADGSRQGGEMTFQELSDKSSCPMP